MSIQERFKYLEARKRVLVRSHWHAWGGNAGGHNVRGRRLIKRCKHDFLPRLVSGWNQSIAVSSPLSPDARGVLVKSLNFPFINLLINVVVKQKAQATQTGEDGATTIIHGNLWRLESVILNHGLDRGELTGGSDKTVKSVGNSTTRGCSNLIISYSWSPTFFQGLCRF